MRSTLRTLEENRAVRVVVLTGAGDKAFCAGGDIADFQKLTTLEKRRAYQIDAMETFSAIETSPLPIIAAVNGWALGGGCELTLACDMAVASQNAVFGMPESALGLVPGFGVLRAPEVIGRQLTKLMVMSGERLTPAGAGRRARTTGSAAGELMTAALDLAERIAGELLPGARSGQEAHQPQHSAGRFRLLRRGVDGPAEQ